MFFIPIANLIAQQISWPLENSTQQAPIYGTVGEIRDGWRFHEGADIGPNSNSYNVYAINTGTTTWNDNSTTDGSIVTIIGNNMEIVRYVHIQPVASIAAGPTQINSGDLIGVMIEDEPKKWPVHVHLENEEANYLNGRLNPSQNRPGAYGLILRGNPATTIISFAMKHRSVLSHDTSRTILHNGNGIRFTPGESHYPHESTFLTLPSRNAYRSPLSGHVAPPCSSNSSR